MGRRLEREPVAEAEDGFGRLAVRRISGIAEAADVGIGRPLPPVYPGEPALAGDHGQDGCIGVLLDGEVDRPLSLPVPGIDGPALDAADADLGQDEGLVPFRRQPPELVPERDPAPAEIGDRRTHLGAQRRVGVLADVVQGVPPGDGVGRGFDPVVGVDQGTAIDGPDVGDDAAPEPGIPDRRAELTADREKLALGLGGELGVMEDERTVRGKPGRPVGLREIRADLAAVMRRVVEEIDVGLEEDLQPDGVGVGDEVDE
jgi:hypothetical protein